MSAAALAVSMGDPAGVGLEIAVKARAAGGTPPFYLIADIDAVRRTAARLASDTAVLDINEGADIGAAFARGLPVCHMEQAVAEKPGAPTPDNAEAIVGAIMCGVGDVREGRASALVTLPVAKATLHAGGFGFPGQTELLGRLTADWPQQGPRGPVMMLANAHLRVALATIHLPLSDVAAALSEAGLLHTCRVVMQALVRDFGIAHPRLALAGLNPHAGEAGALGDEEIEIIDPVAAALRAEGFAVSDARPADTLFHAEARAGFDAVIAMYHDQGLIPIKTLDFWGAVNVTLGLPLVRTSPDHGTGFDIAGQNKANPASFIAALRMAADIAARRGRAQ